MNWKPAGKGIDLDALEERLPTCKKLVKTWLPGIGPCYKIVKSSKKGKFKRKPPLIY